jgi:hypothetical protein
MKRSMKRVVLTMALVGAPALATAQITPQPDSAARPAPRQAFTIPAYRNRIVGVFDAFTGQPVDSVEVSDVMAGNKCLTTSTGTVSLVFLPEGPSLVRVRKLGYEVQSFLVSITPLDSSPITIALSRLTTLNAIVSTDSSPHFVSPGLRGFEERKKAGFGYFIDEGELRKREDQRLPDMITARVPGINMVRVGANAAFLTSKRTSGCQVDVYLDGVRVSKMPIPGTRLTAVNLGQYDVSSLAGVEFYNTATAPSEYGGTGSGCGVLLLWTRER